VNITTTSISPSPHQSKIQEQDIMSMPPQKPMELDPMETVGKLEIQGPKKDGSDKEATDQAVELHVLAKSRASQPSFFGRDFSPDPTMGFDDTDRSSLNAPSAATNRGTNVPDGSNFDNNKSTASSVTSTNATA
jgi:hypothetical protein